jgi:hypothetical protein
MFAVHRLPQSMLDQTRRRQSDTMSELLLHQALQTHTPCVVDPQTDSSEPIALRGFPDRYPGAFPSECVLRQSTAFRTFVRQSNEPQCPPLSEINLGSNRGGIPSVPHDHQELLARFKNTIENHDRARPDEMRLLLKTFVFGRQWLSGIQAQ